MRTLFKITLWTLTLFAASAIAMPKITDHGLKSDFLEYNERYFYGALPQSTSVEWADLSEWNDMGRTGKRADGSYVIQIDPKYHAVLKQADMTLLHEMCHERNFVRLNIAPGTTATESEGIDSHGDAHDGCMVDLAKRGAFKDLW